MWGRKTLQKTHGSAWHWVGEQRCRHGERDSTLLVCVTYSFVLCASGRNLQWLPSPPSWEVVTCWDSNARGHCSWGWAPMQVTAQSRGLMGWYSTWTHNMAPHSATAQQAHTNHTLLLLPRAGTSCPTGKMGQGGRRPGRMAGMATTMSSWTWEASSSHMDQVQCHHPWCSTSLAAPWSSPLQPLAHQDPNIALCDSQKLQIYGRTSSLWRVCCTASIL